MNIMCSFAYQIFFNSQKQTKNVNHNKINKRVF